MLNSSSQHADKKLPKKSLTPKIVSKFSDFRERAAATATTAPNSTLPHRPTPISAFSRHPQTPKPLLRALATAAAAIAAFAPCYAFADLDISNNNNSASTYGCGGYASIQYQPGVTISDAGNITIRNNNAPKYGGFIDARYDSHWTTNIEATGTLTIEGNTTGTAAGNYFDGDDGGVLCAGNETSSHYFRSLQENLIIKNNRAKKGGVLAVEDNLTSTLAVFQAADTISISGNKAGASGGVAFVRNADDAKATIILGKNGGTLSQNLAAQLQGASTDTGGAFHIEGFAANGRASFDIDGSKMLHGSSFIIRDNKVGTGSNVIQRAVYLKASWGPGNAGIIDFKTGEGTIALYDEIFALRTNTQGYAFQLNKNTTATGTFAQIGANGNVFIPGETLIFSGTHQLEADARFQTYGKNDSTAFGSYELKDGSILAAKNTQNILATKTLKLHKNSTLNFDLSAIPVGNTKPLLTLTSAGKAGAIDTSGAFVKPGANNLSFAGNLPALGDYYLLDASDFGANSVATTGTASAPNLTFNGNPITYPGSSSQRQYVGYTLHDSNPAAPDNNSNKLY